jgi:hypothetical protein
MSDERPSEVLGSLPRTRPHRRSEKRAAPTRPDPIKPTTAGATATSIPAKASASTKAPTRTKAATRPPATRAGRAPRSAHVQARRPAAAPGANKRATPAAARVRQPAQPPGTPSSAAAPPPAGSGRADLISSAVHASAELAEIGISAGARALRGVVARLPKP